MALPPIASLSTVPVADQLSAIDTLFEPSPELHALLRPILSDQRFAFASYDALVDAIYSRMSALSTTSDPETKQALFGILGAHPRLGAASPAHLSELSRREQANINAANEQQSALSSLNKEYEDKYPGLRYVALLCQHGSNDGRTFVNGRGRDVIMVDMRRRIDRGNFDQEVRDNIEAMCDIAKDRARKLQQD
ncbi:hypothetical protein UA08_03501 [Talaromyces atroroseus]|uniref:Oxo-4-hydroxy-4-carboxy-5-ureidoimidazoline decarboxylase domain-containing protein n=1 Tax=Talaromyces atroroseus TaxID=1441469 RepID=A0A225B3H9_TALAT|nr:hypothetical protein UA08_03501 [Talaromyces atroroseus]OKL61385.1 hypothetical protein UA08_03501 [Talaromyces atroroseus]